MVTNIKVYLLSDYWAAGTGQLKISFRRLHQRGKGDLTKLRRRRVVQYSQMAKSTVASKSKRFSKQNNNFTRASRFFVHFPAVPVRLQREMTKF